MSTELLSADEAKRLAAYETTIERGLTDAYESFLAIRDQRLYRATHPNFEDYCLDRWGISRQRAYQLIDAARICEIIATRNASADAEMSTRVDKNYPSSQRNTPSYPTEKQARELKKLPTSEIPAAWDEVTAESNGKPTAAKVREVVNRKLGKSAAAPKVNGHSKVNGVLVADPPDVARNRAAGKIAPDVVPEISEPEPETGPTPEPEEAEPTELGDEEWLAGLPLTGQLTGAAAKWFRVDALLYRTLEDARQTFQHHARRALSVARRKGGNGEYAYRVSVFLKLDHPKHWHLCVRTEDGGCGGTGTVGLIGPCPKCRGRGYWIL